MNWRNIVGLLFALIALVSGLFAIFTLAPTTELAIGFMSFTFGILAIIWTKKAVMSLSMGSELRKYTTKFLLSLVFILAFSILNAVEPFYNPMNRVLYLGYLAIIVAYILFVVASYQILSIGKEFGFGQTAEEIRKAIAEKKKSKKLKASA